VNISAKSSAHSELEIGHVLFMDVVGYSKLLLNEQREVQQELTQIVRSTEHFRAAETAGKLVRLPVGDGMALVFFNSPEAPVQCALEIAEALKAHPELKLRMGIHSGPVSGVTDVNDRSNVAGAGINMAQRVMDCGDAGHILLSKRVADDLAQDARWRPQLHELGECSVKHGVGVFVVNLYTDSLGNAQLPGKLKLARQEQAAAKRRRRTMFAGTAVLFAALIALFIYQRHLFRSPAGEPSPEKSIAVLPFENLSKEEENAFFAGGVQDEILTNLAKIADLKVISRTSVMKYKSGPERNLREIAKALGVSHVVEGSVQRAGERVRVSAQLIDARSDAHLWAEHYDRDLVDVFTIQSEIAQQIADRLRSKLSPAEKAAIAERPTSDLKAYELYTQANAINVWDDWQGAEKSMARKVELLEQAIQRDPRFALAYCALAKTQCDLAENVESAHLESAKKAADAALRLRPDLGEGHRELARYYYTAKDFGRAYEELIIARRTLPNDSEIFRIAADIDRRQNRWGDALANFQKASELDPRNDEVTYHLESLCREMRRYNEWEQLLTKDAANHPGPDPWSQMMFAEIKLDKGDPVGAQALLSEVPLDFSPTTEIWETRVTAALYLHDYDGASRVIAATPADVASDAFSGQPPESWADGLIARFRGDKEKAQTVFAAAQKKLESSRGDKTKNWIYFVRLARLEAGVGRKEDAIRDARQALDLMPIAKDAVSGPTAATNLALVYAWTGEPNLAIEQLEFLAKIPCGPSYGDLRFNPSWDSLRGDKRFDKIVAAAKAASR